MKILHQTTPSRSELNYHPYASRGFTMIEVLVSIVVLSVGVLGLVALQSLSVKSNQSAYYRSQASVLIYDIADNMRSNMGADYAAALPSSAPGCISYTASTPSGCTINEVAELDKYKWNTDLDELLPSGKGTITSSAGLTTVTVEWDEDRSGTITDNEKLSMEFQL